MVYDSGIGSCLYIMAMTRASFSFLFLEVEKRIHGKEQQNFVAGSTVKSVCLAFLESS